MSNKWLGLIIMKLIIAFLFLIGTTIQIAQSQETIELQGSKIIVDSNTNNVRETIVDSNTPCIGVTVDQLWNKAYDRTTDGFQWLRKRLYQMPDDITDVSIRAKNYIYSTAASAKDYANNAGIAITNYADAAGANINGFTTKLTTVTVKEDDTETGNKVKQTQVYTTVIRKEGKTEAGIEVEQKQNQA